VIKFDDILENPGCESQQPFRQSILYSAAALGDLLKETPRNTQILYPKDIGFILVNMGIGAGQHIIEAGTGSGALTSALAFSVGDNGKVFSYDAREEMQKIAIKNLTRLGLEERVEFKLRNITDGFDEENVDALFLDVPNPYDYMPQVRKALKTGGFFGSILPRPIRFLC
jgi:tRNA (adenine57-N1/adenine58-N1)-methyltransferase